MAVTLAPLLNPVSQRHYEEFYAGIADNCGFDNVCIGETVCLKRPRAYDGIIRRLKDAGKKVVFCTPLTVLDKDEITVPDGVDAIEINDFAVLNKCGDGLPEKIAGEQLRAYNRFALEFLRDIGFAKAVLPFDLPFEDVAGLPEIMPVEVQVQGVRHLGISGRCHHARFYGCSKADCRLSCFRDGQGLDVNSLTGEALFIINGPQVVSREKKRAGVEKLLPQVDLRVDLSF